MDRIQQFFVARLFFGHLKKNKKKNGRADVEIVCRSLVAYVCNCIFVSLIDEIVTEAGLRTQQRDARPDTSRNSRQSALQTRVYPYTPRFLICPPE